MRKLIWGLLLSLLCAPALANWNDPAYVKRAFSLIALNNEYDNLSHPVRKWHKPIRVYLDHRVVMRRCIPC